MTAIPRELTYCRVWSGSGATSSLRTNFHNAMGSSDSISLTSPSQPQESCSMAWGTWTQPPQHTGLKMSCRIISFRAGNRDAPVSTSLLYTGKKNLLLSNTHIHEVLWACPPMFDEPVSNMDQPSHLQRGCGESVWILTNLDCMFINSKMENNTKRQRNLSVHC